MMKDETANDEIIESVNVYAKMYSYLRQTNNGNKERKKSKGIKKCVKFQDYVYAIFLNKTKRCMQIVIRSYEHNVFTLDINKIAISAHDDKRICIKGFHDMTYQY